jgi:signal transduction histidine kinase
MVTVDAGATTLVVDDDGRGFDTADLERRLDESHLGLRSLGDLVAEAGGTLVIRSGPSRGTRAEVSVPVG